MKKLAHGHDKVDSLHLPKMHCIHLVSVWREVVCSLCGIGRDHLLTKYSSVKVYTLINWVIDVHIVNSPRNDMQMYLSINVGQHCLLCM